MKKIREFIATAVFAGIVLVIVLTIARPILIPPSATNVVNLEWGWREFDYKDARYVQSPMGYMVMVRDHKASLDKVLDLIKHAEGQVLP